MMARVRDVIEASTADGERLRVFGSMSANTGTPWQIKTAVAVETKVIGGTITSSPHSRSSARNATSSATVPLQQEMACRTPVHTGEGSFKLLHLRAIAAPGPAAQDFLERLFLFSPKDRPVKERSLPHRLASQ